jgi:hypothetical protein
VKHAGIFHDDEDNGFKSTNVVVHTIKTGNEQAGSEDVRQGCYKPDPFSLVIPSSVSANEYREWSSEIQVLGRLSGTKRCH